MSRVTIYLRSVEREGEKHLAMFDSNGHGAIDELVTDVQPGDTVIWKLDCMSGIRNISKIFSKEGKRNVFKTEPRKRFLCKDFNLRISEDALGIEAYTIEYILCDDKKVIIDPYIRVPPPEPPRKKA